MKGRVVLLLVLSLGQLGYASENSIEVPLEGREDPEARMFTDAELTRLKQGGEEFGVKKAACERGKAAAKKDIKAGRFRLRDCGEPAQKA
jgi:hypothetical protein